MKGKLEQVMHQTQELQAKQENLKYRSTQLERQVKRLEQLSGQTARSLEDVKNLPSKSIDASPDSQVELFRSMLVQIADLSKRIQAIEKK